MWPTAFARTILKNEKTSVTAAVAAWELEKLDKGLDVTRDKGTPYEAELLFWKKLETLQPEDLQQLLLKQHT